MEGETHGEHDGGPRARVEGYGVAVDGVHQIERLRALRLVVDAQACDVNESE